MRRRALLGTIGAVLIAGCGWSQEQQEGDPRGGPPQRGDGSDGPENDEVNDEDLAASEGGDELIETEPEELLLRAADLDWEGWEETDSQGTGTCNAFEGAGEEFEVSLEACAAVYDDETAAIEGYEDELGLGRKLLTERVDVDPDVGDEAALFREGSRDGLLGEQGFRLVFRDSNATGRIHFTIYRSDQADDEAELGPDGGVSGVIEWGATMHSRWRG